MRLIRTSFPVFISYCLGLMIRGACDGVRAGTVNAQFGEFALGRFEDRPAAVLGVAVRPDWSWDLSCHLTNQLVSIKRPTGRDKCSLIRGRISG